MDVRACLMMVLVVAAACGDDSSGEDDAGSDAGDATVDTGRRDSRPQDTGPQCTPACTGDEDCCVVDGVPTCVNTLTDDNNCGICGIQCGLEFGRGTSCRLGSCECGNIEVGCQGTDVSWCCPPTMDATRAYCANFFTDTSDCGMCGNPCDPRQANVCNGMQCRCGSSRDACTGEPDSVCCAGLAEFECVDTTSDREHCGGCMNRCQLSEDCIDSECIVREAG